MKSTGIVRKIDELGRIVVPKEIRKSMNINEGDTIEIFTDSIGGIVLKKYSIIGELKHYAHDYADTLHDISTLTAVITDRDRIVAVAGDISEIENHEISSSLNEFMSDKDSWGNSKKTDYLSLTSDNDEQRFKYQLIEPIISNGDSIGAVLFLSDTKEPDDVHKKLLKTAAKFLGNQIIQ